MSAARALKNGLSQVAWRTPGRFALAKRLSPGLGGRALVFHDIAAHETPLTAGLGVSLHPEDFERTLEFLGRHYTFVDLAEWQRTLGESDSAKPPLLITFDDAYASVERVALPICRRLGVPALMFMNASFIDNAALAIDNLICFASNTRGLELVEQVAGRSFRHLASVYSEYLPTLDLDQRAAFGRRLADEGGIDVAAVLDEYRPYLTREEVLGLVAAGFEIGNHTFSHTHLRSLTPEQCRSEIAGNKERLEALTKRPVRTFSYPYGANEDSGGVAINVIERTGHEAAFLVEGRLNSGQTDPYQYMRVSLRSFTDAGIFSEIEVLPRLRELRERLR